MTVSYKRTVCISPEEKMSLEDYVGFLHQEGFSEEDIFEHFGGALSFSEIQGILQGK